MEHPVPEVVADVVREELAALRALVDRVGAAVAAGDAGALRELAAAVRRRMRKGDDRALGNLEQRAGEVVAEFDALYDAAFPPSAADGVAALLDAPWPSAARRAALAAVLGCADVPRLPLSGVADRALADADVPLLRLLVTSPLSTVGRETVAAALDALHRAGALDAAVVEHAFTEDPWLGYAIVGRTPYGTAAGPPAACADAVRAHVDALTWRLVTGPGPVDWEDLPKVLAPQGLRFVRVALEWRGDPRAAGHLGAAVLTDGEREALVALLRELPAEEQRRVFAWRLGVGDADALLPLFDLGEAAGLLRLVLAIPDGEVVRQDRSAVLAAVAAAGPERARRLLALVPSELVSAVMGWNRAEVVRRFRRNALHGTAAYGMLPLDDGETVLDRYLALRESAKKGARLGPNRRHSHAAAVDVALEHLAQVAGVAEASRLEWDCEARIASAFPTEAGTGPYRTVLRFGDDGPLIETARNGRVLKSVPAAVRADPAYRELREQQERLREQARRMRSGLVERLVATAGTLPPQELGRLLSLPAGAAMLRRLVWRDGHGSIGLLDDVDTTGPVSAVHPVELLGRRSLADWQGRIVAGRVRQPVKQVFREVYVLTAAEREAGDVSRRFAGQVVDGRTAGRLLSGRGWSTHGEYAHHQATRAVGGELTAALRCDVQGWFGMGPVVVGELRFVRGAPRGGGGFGGVPVPLAEVPPVVLSETMRDLDLVVSVAGTEPAVRSSPAQAASRAQVLAALVADLGLTRVSVEGHTAVVSGTRATYRVHLVSGSVHVEPGGHLCVVPASFGSSPHPRLFLPFADEDRMTGIVLSKVLLLAEDERIDDPSILAQLRSLTGGAAG
ncbi:DUF4132 domain-containing protein [Streptomyces genisteinicus]|uniref:DUF4132 domain-containing protein n=1 Tax=Streptomyces genisteinicus TaxID=2768068 RepID=A0A7H0HM81_9ACTN|nr:DUF4132 domain-containing protein [Streptomyces genisteinicus]QNP61647.1 DUF4132 domain-containing protein [Streptomyces genisteinicus]